MPKNIMIITITIVLIFIVFLSTPTIACAMTKQDVLDQIESFQKNSTENEINASIETLLKEKSAEYKNQLVVNIQDFGAKGNGVDSDVDALKKANGYVSTKGGGSIFFPATSQNYVFDNGVTISKNVNLIGDKTKISRYHNYEVNPVVFNFMGNNIMDGFIYDGGLTRIPDVGNVQDEFTHYHDFHIYDEGCIFSNNLFLNTKGSFIGGQGNTIIYANAFGEYGDHCIYLGGSAGKTEKVIISNNTFTALKSTRDAVKFRNNGEMVIVANNTFDIPMGSLFTFASDQSKLQGNLENISFSYNIIKNCTNIGLIGRENLPTNSELSKINNIKISNNIIDSCSGYLTIGGASWAVNTNIDYFDGTNIDICNNTFNSTPQIHLACKGNGLKVNISGNRAYGLPKNDSFIMMYGNTSLNLSNNMLDFDNNTTLIDSPYQYSNYTSATAGIKATTPQTINISGNTISGIRKIYQEYSDKNATYLTDMVSCNLSNNTFTKNGLGVGLGIDSGLTSLIKAKLKMSSNSVIQDGQIASIYVEDYPKDYLFEGSNIKETAMLQQ